MSRFSITNIDPDAVIQCIGDLFKKDGDKYWGVNLQFWPKQAKRSLSLSNARILIRKRTVSQNTGDKPRGWEQDFVIPNTADWEVCKVKDCPIPGFSARMDATQYCFRFQISDGKNVFLPHFELARAMFLRDSYLSRTAMTPGTLINEFDVQISQGGEEALINVLPSASYSVSNYDDLEARNTLSWILLDPDARRSYESIGHHQLHNGFEKDSYRYWRFKFSPPLLRNTSFRVRGWFDGPTNSLFVFEIDWIHNIFSNIPNLIEYDHPSFSHSVSGQGTGGFYQAAAPSEELEIEDGSLANADTHQTIIRTEGTTLTFARPFITRKASTTGRPSPHGKSETDAPYEGGRPVSTEEAVTGQGFPCADWGNAANQEDYSHLFANKFDCFTKMVDVLVKHYGCIKLSQRIIPLPVLPRCKKHIMTDGSPRCIADIKIFRKGKFFHLLEVDTSDAEKSLSTQLIRVGSDQDWDRGLKRVMAGLVRSSLNWPTHILITLSDSTTRPIKITHPKTPSVNKGVLPPDSIAGWAERVCGQISEL